MGDSQQLMSLYIHTHSKRPLMSVRWFQQGQKTSVIPCGNVVSGRDGDAPPSHPIPTTVWVSGEDALPASVAIATTVSQRQLLDLHGCADVQVSLRTHGSNNNSVITEINQLLLSESSHLRSFTVTMVKIILFLGLLGPKCSLISCSIC